MNGFSQHHHFIPFQSASNRHIHEPYYEGRVTIKSQSNMKALEYENTTQLTSTIQVQTNKSTSYSIFYALCDENYNDSLQKLKELLKFLSARLVQPRAKKEHFTLVVDDSAGFCNERNKVKGSLSPVLQIINKHQNSAAHVRKHLQILYFSSLAPLKGNSGAFLSGDRYLMDYMRWTCVGYMFSTAPSPLTAKAAEESIRELAITRNSFDYEIDKEASRWLCAV